MTPSLTPGRLRNHWLSSPGPLLLLLLRGHVSQGGRQGAGQLCIRVVLREGGGGKAMRGANWDSEEGRPRPAGLPDLAFHCLPDLPDSLILPPDSPQGRTRSLPGTAVGVSPAPPNPSSLAALVGGSVGDITTGAGVVAPASSRSVKVSPLTRPRSFSCAIARSSGSCGNRATHPLVT